MARLKASQPIYIDLLMKKRKKPAHRNLYLTSFKHWVGAMGWRCIIDQNGVWLGFCRKEYVLHAGARTMVERTCSEFNCGSCRAVAPLRQKATPPWVTTAVAVVSGPNEEAVDGDGCGSALLPSSAQHDLILDSDFRVGRINRLGWFLRSSKNWFGRVLYYLLQPGGLNYVRVYLKSMLAQNKAVL